MKNVDSSVRIFELVCELGLATRDSIAGITGFSANATSSFLGRMVRSGALERIDIPNPDYGQRPNQRSVVHAYRVRNAAFRPRRMGAVCKNDEAVVARHIRALEMRGYVVTPPQGDP